MVYDVYNMGTAVLQGGAEGKSSDYERGSILVS
jgi:hypothetical protein